MADRANPPTPVIIVGAGRSGTNMLRDALVQLPGFATWKCDEINPVWRHGHFFRPDDELGSSDVTGSSRKAVRRAFERVVRENPGTGFVVEKTCANSLRLAYVDAALRGSGFAEPRFIQIIRDGRDVVPSAGKRWWGELEVGGGEYFLAKAAYTPLIDLPLYAASFAKARLRRMLGMTDRLESWGPKYAGMKQDMDRPLDEICALQWKACVDRSDSYLTQLAESRWMRIYYEDFVADPAQHLRAVAEFLQAEAGDQDVTRATADIRAGSVGKGLRGMAQADQERLESLMQDTLNRHNYGSHTQ